MPRRPPARPDWLKTGPWSPDPAVIKADIGQNPFDLGADIATSVPQVEMVVSGHGLPHTPGTSLTARYSMRASVPSGLTARQHSGDDNFFGREHGHALAAIAMSSQR